MKEVILSPVSNFTEEVDAIEARIIKLLKDELYLPLLREADDTLRLTNAADSLTSAIMSGRVTYYRGLFKGRFSASISRELRSLKCVWDRGQGCYRLPLSKLPEHIKHAIKMSEYQAIKKLEAIDRRIRELSPVKIAEQLRLADLFDRSIHKIDGNIQKTLDRITVMPKLTDEARAKIAESYNTNMTRYIQDFTEKEIITLRSKVEKHTMEGGRYEDMIETIQRRYEVSQSKAKFLARQETNLFVSSFKEARYKDAGIVEYVWKCVVGTPTHPVRHSHKILDGKKFRYDSPPTTSSNGKRNNPGEDYGCRCTSRPVVKF